MFGTEWKERHCGHPKFTHHSPEVLHEEAPHACYEGFVYIGHISNDELDGEPVEVIERVPCPRCHNHAKEF